MTSNPQTTKKKKSEQRIFRVELRCEVVASAEILASSLQEAQEKADAGKWNGFHYDELVDWNPVQFEEDFL